MPGYPTILALPAVSLFPWFITFLASAAFGIMLFLYFRQKRRQRRTDRWEDSSARRKLELLYALVDSMPDWIYIKDRESRFILANKHMASYHGITDPDEMIGRTDFDYYPEDIARGFREDEIRIMESGESIVNQEEKIQDAEGAELILSTTKIPVRDPAGNTVGIVGIGRNITRQKNDQLRLRELSEVASTTENVVVIMDAEGNFKWVNKGFEERYGCTMEAFIKQNGINLKDSSSNEQIEDILEEVKQTKKPYTYYTRTQNKNGTDAWFQTHITPILNDVGEITSQFLFDVDITPLKKADLQIKQQKYELEFQRDQLRSLNASKDRLFSIIAHDLKNPFQAIIGFSELLKDEFRILDARDVEEYLNCIYNSSTSAYGLLYNLLEWARAQTRSIKVVPEEIQVRKISGDILELLSVQARDKEIRFDNRIDEKIRVTADRNMFQTILRNLVANAVKYTAKGGSIFLESAKNGKSAYISIRDTGVGMPEEKIKTLFSLEKGSSTPGTEGETGTGLGLLVCHEFLTLNKGHMKVESKPGKGSTFTISLPFPDK